MDAFVKLIQDTYGLAGLLILSPLIGMMYLWKNNQKLQGDIQTMNERIVDAHKQRVDDAQNVSDKLIQMVSEHASLAKETNLALDRVGDTLSMIQNTGRLAVVQRKVRTDEG